MKLLHKKNRGIVLSFLVTTFLSHTSLAYGANYTLLETIGDPGGPQAVAGGSVTFQQYASAAYSFLIRGSIVAAVLMLIIAGAEYAGSGVSEAGKKDAKEKINNVFFGILGLVTAYFILYQINPKIVSIDLNTAIPALGTQQRSVSETTPPPNFQTSGTKENKVAPLGGKSSPPFGDEAAVRKELGIDQFSPIQINNEGRSCPPGKVFVKGQSTGCTNVGGLGTDAVIGLKQLQKECNCTMTITGGTEGPGIVHESHGPGKNQVDLRFGNDSAGLDQYIYKSYERKRETPLGTEYVMKNGDIFRDETAGTRHWHVIFNNNRGVGDGIHTEQ